jgi:hypothetical protein
MVVTSGSKYDMRKPDDGHQTAGILENDLEFSIEGSEPGKDWITSARWGFVKNDRHSKIMITSSLFFVRLIEILRVFIKDHSNICFREKCALHC